MAGRSGGLRLGTAALFTAVALALAIGASIAYTYYLSSVGEGDEAVTVRIEPGSDLRQIGRLLREAGVIAQERPFLFAARLAGLDRQLRSGEYDLKPSWNLPTLLDTLSSGHGRMLSVTIPEGVTLVQIAERLEAAGITDGEEFLRLARNQKFYGLLGIPGPSAEGFLYPETYLFAAGSRPEEVIASMYRQFQEEFVRLRAEAPPTELSDLEIVTLASIVERETALPEERPLVAAVFTNRLRKGYRLQSDPTVIYGIEDFDGNLTRRDLETPTPYNTYVIRGLPPGPIANPGRGALSASLSPADVDYLYFVSRNDGSHHFSRSLEEHNRAVHRYQVARRRSR